MLRVCVSAVLALWGGVASSQEAITWAESVQGWHVAIDTTIDDSCFILSGLESGTYVRFQFNVTDNSVQLIIADENWSAVHTGQDYNVAVSFEGREPWAGTAVGHRWLGTLPSLVLSVPLEDDQAFDFIAEFSGTRTFAMSVDGSEVVELAFSGTDAAIKSMLECQASVTKAKSGHGLNGSMPSLNSEEI